jgi:uncharacterized damage-inducible protein DinB
MSKEIYEVLAKYNQAANEKMNAVIAGISDADWNKEFGGYFKSIRSLASHVYVADFSWVKRFSNLREFAILKDPLFSADLNFKDLLFPGKDEYLSKRPELDKKIVSFISEITESDLSKTLKYSNAQGTTFEKPVYGALLQVLNHETHHRGMISLYLELLGKDNDFSSVLATL